MARHCWGVEWYDGDGWDLWTGDMHGTKRRALDDKAYEEESDKRTRNDYTKPIKFKVTKYTPEGE